MALQVATVCFDALRNYSSTVAIIAAFDKYAIYRLSRTWAGVGARLRSRVRRLRQEVVNEHGYVKGSWVVSCG